MTKFKVTLDVRDLTAADVPGLKWAGGKSHLAAVAKEVERAAQGEADYFGAFLPSGRSAGKAGITYIADAGVIWQVAVHPVLQSCGIGTELMNAAEHRIVARGFKIAQLAVEENNPQAQKLYERLGYQAVGTEDSAWDHDLPDGTVGRYETVLTIMRKTLGGEGV